MDAPLRPGPRSLLDEDDGDQEPTWVPDPSETVSFWDIGPEDLTALAVFGGLLILSGIVFLLEPARVQWTVEGGVFVLLFVGLLAVSVGAVGGFRSLTAAGGAVLLAVLIQVLSWPSAPPVWASASVLGVGAACLVLGCFYASKSSGTDP